jgi:hypothetical protein
VTHIAHLIKTSSLVRIFLVVVLSLGMAWLIGSGVRVQNANSATDLDQAAPASLSVNSTSISKSSSAAAQSSNAAPVASTTSLDKAVRLLGGVDRERNSTGSSNLAKSGNNKVATDGTENSTTANSGTTSKLGNGANVQVVPGK